MKKLLIVLLALLVGCAHIEDLNRRIQNPKGISTFNNPSIKKPSLKEIMDSLKGRHISGVIRGVGPANQIASDETGGRIYVWVFQGQRRIPKYRWLTKPRTPRKVQPPQPQLEGTTTTGTMRWDQILKRWEYNSETRPNQANILPDISGDVARILNKPSRSRLHIEYLTRTKTQRIMLFTRSDGTIYHYLID